MAVSRVFLRYLAFQIPGFCLAAIALTLLARWTSLTDGAALVLFGLWVLKDLAIYPWAKVGYDSRPGQGGTDGLLGSTGTVLDDRVDEGSGHVRVGAERWRARLVAGEPVGVGAQVRVVEVHGLTLVVERVDAPD